MASSISPPPITHPDISDTEVRSQLERMLASKSFRGADAQKRFLRYVVESVLDGRERQIKELSIGIKVFERGDAFDPRIDNIVRVEARKLRARIDRYYESEGAADPLRILLSARGYMPTFQNSAELASKPEVEEVASAVIVSSDPATHPDQTDFISGPHQPLPVTGYRKIIFGLALAAILALLWSVAARVRSGRTPLNETPSIAVLPFQNLGEVQDGVSFSDGLADELIDALGRVQGIRVIARSSSFQFRGRSSDLAEIGRKLNVRMVLEGSVARYGNKLRINAQLDDARNGLRVWSASFDRDTKDVLNVQQEISEAIVDAFRSRFAIRPEPAATSSDQGRAVDPEAYRYYLQGVFFWNKNTAAGLKAAIGYFEQAVTRDPGYARAWAGLARCYVGLPSFSVLPGREAVAKIRAAAFRSLALDPSQGEAHIYLGYAAMIAYDWQTAEREFQNGLERDPGNAVGHRWYANYLLSVGKAGEALAENERAEDLDPVSPYMITGTSRTLYILGRNDEAIARSRKALLLDPDFGSAHQHLGAAYLQNKMYSEAIAEFKTARQEMENDSTRTAWLAYAYAVAGRTSEARALLNGLLSGSPAKAFPAKALAQIYIGLGDKDKAFESLARAVKEPTTSSLLLKVDPIYAPLRSDPRYGDLLAAMALR
jgi:TolB-like protein/Flp pilus assembly protein TadD